MLAVFMVEPAVEPGCGESRRVAGKARFQGLQRQRAFGDKKVEHSGGLGVVHDVEDRIIGRHSADVAMLTGRPQVGHEPPPGDRAVDLEGRSEDGVRERNAGSSLPLFLGALERTGQAVQERLEAVLFFDLCRVIRWPVLTVGDADSARFRYRAVWCRFPPHHKLDSEGVFALDAAQFVVRARTPELAILPTDRVSSVLRLRGDLPDITVASDPSRCRQLKSPLLAFIHALSLQHKTQCSYIVATCQALIFRLTCSYVLATLCPMAKIKRSARSASASRPTKDAVVRMRISTAQKRALATAAARDGLELSAWLRQLALRAAGVLPEAK